MELTEERVSSVFAARMEPAATVERPVPPDASPRGVFKNKDPVMVSPFGIEREFALIVNMSVPASPMMVLPSMERDPATVVAPVVVLPARIRLFP